MIIPYSSLITYQQQREHLLMAEYEVLGFYHFPKFRYNYIFTANMFNGRTQKETRSEQKHVVTNSSITK